MKVQRFRASSLQEALQLVRDNLGPDASVLSTRSIKEGRLFKKSLVEVEASDNATSQQTLSRAEAVKSQQAVTLAEHAKRAETETTGLSEPTADLNQADNSPRVPNSQLTEARSAFKQESRIATEEASPGWAAGWDSDLERAPQGSRRTIRDELRASQMTSGQFEAMSVLLDEGFEPSQARQLVEDASDRCRAQQLKDAWVLQGQICQVLARQLKTGRSIDSIEHGSAKTVALVGPTGVGKTTTLAKIAAGLRFEFGAQLGLITLDTFRMGAVDQLLQYAELISAPLEVVSSADQVAGALDRLRECDLILIDTAGRSPRDVAQLNVLQEMLASAQPDETILVASATSSTAHVRNTIAEFSQLNPTSLAITKFDESTCFGGWYELLQGLPIPVSYLSAGQDVPNDLVLASGRRLASWLLGKGQRDS